MELIFGITIDGNVFVLLGDMFRKSAAENLTVFSLFSSFKAGQFRPALLSTNL